MAYTITVHEDAEFVYIALLAALSQSRFTCEGSCVLRKRGVEIQIRNVRLREAKPYCGNHPGPCRVIPGFDRPHRKGRWLEGLDWVSFNDMVNDVLDELKMEAWVKSSVCEVRKGRMRRIYYGMTGIRHTDQVEWDKDGDPVDYADCIDKEAPSTRYTRGTPGIYGWKTKTLNPEETIMELWVIVRTDGMFVAPPGREKSYTDKLQDAWVFKDRRKAHENCCTGNESVFRVTDYLNFDRE